MTTIATECTACPPGIKMCAHLDGRVVWLAENRRLIEHQGITTSTQRWSVFGPKTIGQCGCPVDHVVMAWHLIYPTDSLPDAEAEFERRCALLRAEA